MSDAIKICGIVGESITDGPGFRFALFVQGCPHGCPGCHNPQTHPFEGGERLTADEIFAMIKKNPLIKGVTFSGGEPMGQSEALMPLAKMIKEAGLELAIYTGYTFEEIAEDPLLAYADVVVDGRFMVDQKSYELKFKGSSNQRIIDVKKSLEAGNVVLNEDMRWN